MPDTDKQIDSDRSRLNWVFGIVLLAGVAGLMSTIVYLASRQTPAVPSANPGATASHSASPPAPVLAKPCYDGSVRVLKKVPLSLFSASATVPGLDWVRVKVHNGCTKPLNIKVTLRRQASLENPRQDVTFDGNLLETYLQPGRKIDRTATPTRIQLLQARFANTLLLNLTWEIRNLGDGQLLAKDTQEVRLLPRDVILWDLRTVADRPLDKTVILASLSNWIYEDGPVTSKLARELITGQAGGGRWVKPLYNYFLDPASPHRVAVQSSDPSWMSLSPNGQQRVRVAEDLLAGPQTARIVSPWELAMLFATLAQASGNVPDQLGVIAVQPDEGGASPPVLVLLAWSADGGNTWKAVSMNSNQDASFEANVGAASALLSRRLASDGQARAALKGNGSVLAADIAAVNLRVAASRYGMRGLP